MILVQPYNLVAMALAAYQLEQREHAVELLEENIRAYPVYSPSYERIVQILIQLKRQPEAKEYLQKLEGIAGENQLTQGLRKLVDS
jgi:tetratricopeptide (TPR) repeat protein